MTRGRHDFVVKDAKPQQGFFKTSKKQNAMFPFKEKKVKVDDYGEVINPDDYRVDVERERGEEIKEEVLDEQPGDKEAPTKCVVSARQVRKDASSPTFAQVHKIGVLFMGLATVHIICNVIYITWLSVRLVCGGKLR